MTDKSETALPLQDNGHHRGNHPIDWSARITLFTERVVQVIAKHWLLLVNAVIGLWVTLPAVAPLLMKTGHPQAAQLVYTLFMPLCHQLPERSFFLFGPRGVYSLAELEHSLGTDVPLRYIGSPALGYKIAVCERDNAVYAAALLTGIVFSLVRRHLRRLPIRHFVLLCMPMAVDGLGQLLGFWESTWQTRIITGGVFGAACIGLAYPYIENGMNEVLQVMQPAPRTHSS